jgi:hypothetical protein
MGAKTLHILSHIPFTLTPLPSRRNRVLFGRPLLVADYTRFDMYVLRNLFCPLNAHKDTICASFVYGDSLHKLLKLNRNRYSHVE